MQRPLVIAAILSLLAFGTLRAEQQDMPKHKQTKLGLYVTASQAFHRWRADPDNVKIIDVRTPEEYVFVGHAEMAWNVPLTFQVYQWDAEKKQQAMKLNPQFVNRVKQIVKPTDTILVVCRSGKRGAPAVNLLAEAGFKNVHHIFNGMEGDKVNDPASVFHGKRMKNGWKNSGLPWTYDLDRANMYLMQE